MCRRLIVCLSIIFVLCTGGCSLPWPVDENGQSAEKQVQPEARNTEGRKTNAGQLRVAQPLAGQKENPVISPQEYGEMTAGVQETLATLMESLRINDLTRASTCLYGFDQDERKMSLEELQREVEMLYPVEWRLEAISAAGKDGVIVEVIYTMPDGTTYVAKPFSMTRAGDAWAVHFNSFADSFASMAGHLLNRGGEAGNQAVGNYTT